MPTGGRRRCCRCTRYSAEASANRGADARTTPAAGNRAYHGPSTSAQQPAAECTLTGIIGVWPRPPRGNRVPLRLRRLKLIPSHSCSGQAASLKHRL